MRAIAYTRVSTEEQTTEGVSLHTSSTGHGRLTDPLVLEQAEDARELILVLKNGRSYPVFCRDMARFGTRSMGSLHGWAKGNRVPTLAKLIELAAVAGARIVIVPDPTLTASDIEVR